MDIMKLYRGQDSWILCSNKNSLWFNITSQAIYTKQQPVDDSILSTWNAKFVSDVYCYIGQLKIIEDGINWLLFVKSQEYVSKIKHQEIYRITDVLIKPFADYDEDVRNLTRPSSKIELRYIEDLRLLYQETQCFYYSQTYDLTNTVQRIHKYSSIISPNTKEMPLWKLADDRFFWNKLMLKQLIDCKNNSEFDPWIQPIIMGYVDERHCKVGRADQEEKTDAQIILISRRNRFRSGVRMHCRGVDSDGNVANYVETEQILNVDDHIMSFVMIRGSIPVFWSQQGIKYRPPPKIDK
ncbi:unnamed protein product, partial [Didymodactylos carnosus]